MMESPEQDPSDCIYSYFFPGDTHLNIDSSAQHMQVHVGAFLIYISICEICADTMGESVGASIDALERGEMVSISRRANRGLIIFI